MEVDPYHPAKPIPPPPRRRVHWLTYRALIVVAALTAAILLVYFAAPKWSVVFAGVVAALAADSMLGNVWSYCSLSQRDS